MSRSQYFAIYKPFQTLSQFSAEGDKKTLKDYFDVPKDVYPVGRLDYDSEGLLVLTNDKQLNHKLLHPSNAHKRTYYVQVDGQITPEAIRALENGVCIAVDGKSYLTRPCMASLLLPPPIVPDRYPPIRVRKSIPAPWIAIILKEGKNRQVRKMCAAVGFPVVRLIRFAMEEMTIQGLEPGQMYEYTKEEVKASLFL